MSIVALSSRAYAGEADLECISRFVNQCETSDGFDEITSVDELSDEFATPGFDATRDLRLWFDEQGQLVVFGQLWASEENAHNDGFLWYKVAPEWRNSDPEAELFSWATARVREYGRTALSVVTRDNEPWRIAAYERYGFRAVRYFLRMRRMLDTPIEAPQFPAGYTLVDGDHDPERWAEMYNASFIDHYNFHPATADKVRYWQQETDYRPDLNLVACAPDGSYAAFAWNTISRAENNHTGLQNGHIGLLGTRRGYRRQGLGRAMLLASLQRLAAIGMQSASLGVDAESPTGATQLYTAAGFQEYLRRILYRRELSNQV
ncbi:MAG TPA: GNAT family N-acetyltransferase [Roseiflexaceae bacterium]|nr:GNAT family N-acetyltransferase [Roseiflexaceae bacterium]HMP39601.1 GNAT family N-acetyltransferase [Roseiflexaceae bacterium]